VAQAQLVKDKRLTGKWELDDLKRELEGVSYAMINIRKKEMKLAGTLIKIPLILKNDSWLKKFFYRSWQ